MNKKVKDEGGKGERVGEEKKEERGAEDPRKSLGRYLKYWAEESGRSRVRKDPLERS